MRALLVEAPGSVAIREVPDPTPGPAALVRMQRVGLCGTDRKFVHGAVAVDLPRILGHELVGRVAVAGRRNQPPEGTRVLVDPNIACGRCPVCRYDRPHLCPHGALMGRDVDGGAADYATVDEDRLYPIPAEISDDAAAVLQPLATCVHAQDSVAALPGQTAVVVGLGVAGLLHTQLLRVRGVRQVIGVTRSEWKRELATDLGADLVVHPEEAAEAVADATDGYGADVVVESAGTPETLRQATVLAGPGGTVVAFGITARADAMPTYEWYFKELTIVSPRSARPRDFPRAIALARRQLRLAPLVSASYPLHAAAEALASLDDSDRLKVVLEV